MPTLRGGSHLQHAGEGATGETVKERRPSGGGRSYFVLSRLLCALGAIWSPSLFRHSSSYPNVPIYPLITHLFCAPSLPPRKPASTDIGLCQQVEGLGQGDGDDGPGVSKCPEEQEMGAAGKEAEQGLAYSETLTTTSDHQEFASETQTVFHHYGQLEGGQLSQPSRFPGSSSADTPSNLPSRASGTGSPVGNQACTVPGLL